MILQSVKKVTAQEIAKMSLAIEDLARSNVEEGKLSVDDLDDKDYAAWAAVLCPDAEEWIELASMDQLNDAVLDAWEGKRVSADHLFQIVQWLAEEIVENKMDEINEHLKLMADSMSPEERDYESDY